MNTIFEMENEEIGQTQTEQSPKAESFATFRQETLEEESKGDLSSPELKGKLISYEEEEEFEEFNGQNQDSSDEEAHDEYQQLRQSMSGGFMAFFK